MNGRVENPIRIGLAVVGGWWMSACIQPPNPQEVPIEELSKQEEQIVFPEEEGILRMANEFINPEYFKGGIRFLSPLMDMSVDTSYRPGTLRAVRAVIAKEGEEIGQPFSIINAYDKDGLYETSISAGTGQGIYAFVKPEFLPGRPLRKGLEGASEEELLTALKIIYRLPELTYWETGPFSYVPELSPDWKPVEYVIGVGHGKDQKGRDFMVNVATDGRANLSVTHDGRPIAYP